MLLGGSGMLGRAFRELFARRGLELAAPASSVLDLTAPSTIEAQLPADVALVVNCAAWTDVDGAEEHAEQARRINGDAVGALAAACRKRGALLVHFSTDYVFDGQASEPYGVDHPRSPVNAYGHGKAVGELALEQSGADYLLVRTSWVYAPWGKNFVRKIVELAGSRDSLRVVDDQRGRPSSAEGIARTTLALVESGARGTFHVTDGGECTWCELARAAVQAAGLACRVAPCSSDEYPTKARRPAYSVLDVRQTIERVGPLPEWSEAVRDVVRRF